LVSKYEGKRPPARTNFRREDNIKMNRGAEGLGSVDWDSSRLGEIPAACSCVNKIMKFSQLCRASLYYRVFIYPNDAQLDCSKNVKIYIKIYKRGAATCFGFSQPSSGSYCMCFAKVIKY
jgi:hypothetical protein